MKKSAVFLIVTTFHRTVPKVGIGSACNLSLASFLLSFLYDPEYGGDVPPNIWLSPNNTTLQPRKLYSSN